jgi:hypothetical protein
MHTHLLHSAQQSIQLHQGLADLLQAHGRICCINIVIDVWQLLAELRGMLLQQPPGFKACWQDVLPCLLQHFWG